MNEPLEPDLSRIKRNLAALVGIDTQNPPGQESLAAQWIREQLSQMGMTTELDEFLPGRVNAFGTFTNGPGPTFAFNTHIDVVPVGAGWSSDPHTLTERDGRLYGRGSCDAKGPLACMLEAMRLLIAQRSQWSGTLIAAFVADEEASSKGAKHYAKSGVHIDFCVVGEPTSCAPVTAHKGSLRPIVRCCGVAAHSGTPDLGVNAIQRIATLLKMTEEEHARLRGISHPLVGSPTLTVTRISGGHADNVVPESCEAMLDRRMVPGEDERAVKESLAAMVAEMARVSGTTCEIVEYRPTTGGATETPQNHPLVQATLQACRAHLGRDIAVGGFLGGCDLVHLRTMGAAGVVLGPGTLEVAHKPDEFVPIEELTTATLIYLDVALSMLSLNTPSVFTFPYP